LFIITFYSFKGGVGRTMALVNTAAELAGRGRKVLVVDFDLEAPGLNTYELLRSEKPHPGIVEYVTEFRRTRHSPLVTDFIYEARPVGKKGGRLWVMPAGRGDPEYGLMLNNLNWQTLYKDEEGFLLFEDTRSQWEAELHPDYVLIDARTGHTDIEGICTRHLADAVVVLFFPNEQNLVGLKDVCRRIRDEQTRGLKKDIRLHFVMSNVPDLDDKDQVLDQRLRMFHKELGIVELAAVIHRYESVLLFNQAIFIIDKPQSRLAEEYRKLSDAIIRDNDADRDVALEFLHNYSQLYLPEVARDPEGYESYAHLHMQRFLSAGRIENITQLFWEDADVMAKVADCRMLEGSFGSALRLFDWVISIRKDFAPALLQRALCRNRLGDIPGAEADLLRYLQVPGLRPHDVVRAVRELVVISPAVVPQALKVSSVKDLHVEWKQKVAEILAKDRYGRELAIEYLIEAVHDRDINESGVFGLVKDLSYYLIQSRRWQEASSLIEKAVHTAVDSYVIVILALDDLVASWGMSGILSEGLCRWWLNYAQCEEVGPWESPLLNEVNALASWRLGDISRAQQEIETAIQWMERHGMDRFSCWRYQLASPLEFLEDCHQIKRLIQGEPVQPAFLSEPDPPAQRARAR
jgi:cellulose biosynthesis protein BcsQ